MRAPDGTQRVAIIGRTGSGKTQAACWHLSRADFDKRPWIVVDYKGDKLIRKSGAREVDYKKSPPKKPGLYVIRPLPNDTEAVTDYLWGIWANEMTGLYVDEGYMMGRTNAAFRALLTQGRSKNIPMIVLSQRPAWMDVFVFSEADFFQVFHLNNYMDRRKVEEFVPWDMEAPLRRYHSIWYDVGLHETALLQPVAASSSIVSSFRERLQPKRVTL